MKKTLITTIVSLFAAAGAYAAVGTDGAVTTSTDPAKAAAVERHAQELQARDAKVADQSVVHAGKKAHKHRKHHASQKAVEKK
jgi:hypothetical protein